MKKNRINKMCMNCAIGKTNGFNNDILCEYNGIVSVAYYCSKHIYQISSDSKKCFNCANGNSNGLNKDIFCKYKGMVFAESLCSKHVYKNLTVKASDVVTYAPKPVTALSGTSPVVCIIAEGSYPYITGGVSSWIQMLIKGLPEYRFIIYAIGAEDKNRGKFVYSLPDNVIEVKEVFLNTFLTGKANWGRRFNLSKAEKKALGQIFKDKDTDMNSVFNIIRKSDSISDFILSKSFFDVLTEAYSEKFPHVSFIDFFWTVRSMVLPLFNLIRESMPQADLYHSVSAGYAGVIGAMCKHLYNKPYIVTEHGIYTREREEEIIKSTWVKGYFKDMWIDLFYLFSKSAYKSADRIISLFKRNMEIQIEIGCTPEKIQIIPNGVDLDSFVETVPATRNKSRINIGAVIRMVPIKDIKTMIHAFALVKEEIPNADFYIMGPIDEDEEYFEECVKLVELLDIKDVNITGKVNVKDYIFKMEILVLTSISEGQPLAILEGMACKKPFVATDVGSCKELLYGNNDLYGDAGIIVPVMDYIKISNAIIKLCKDEFLRKEMGRNGYNRVSELYTLNRVICSYRELYREFGG